MRRLQIIIGDKEHVFTGPTSYSEVKDEMILRLMRLIKDSKSKPSLLLMIPQIVYNIPMNIMQIFLDAKRISRRGKTYITDSDEDPDSLILLFEQLLKTCEWALTTGAPTNWLFDKVKIGNNMFFAPKNKLADLTFGEFFFTEQYAREDPAKLCALLYRTKKWPSWTGVKNQPRKKFDLQEVISNSRYFQGEKQEEFRTYVQWNYSGMVDHLAAIFPNAFQKSTAELGSVQGSGSSPWLDAALSMSEGNPVTFEKFEQTNVFLALKILDNRIKSNKELEAAYKK